MKISTSEGGLLEHRDRPSLQPAHPGKILRDEFLTPMKISVYELANAIKVPRTRANDIVLGRRAITMRGHRKQVPSTSIGST